MTVFLNDLPKIVPGGTSLKLLLELAGVDTAGVATAVNGEVVPSSERGEFKLSEGDKVLLIKAFYGG